MSETIVSLAKEQTKIDCPPNTRRKAINAAFWITASPSEHAWAHEEQKAMAAYCLWAHQRLCAIEQCASGELEHQADEKERMPTAEELVRLLSQGDEK
jgi:hypothetical protein